MHIKKYCFKTIINMIIKVSLSNFVSYEISSKVNINNSINISDAFAYCTLSTFNSIKGILIKLIKRSKQPN